MKPASRSSQDLSDGNGTTIAQIAVLAGVSVATVSKVVNGRADVAPDTRAAVETIIREHGYRQKKANRATLVELVLHELKGAYAMEIIKGVERVAVEHGLALVVSESEGRHTLGRNWIEAVIARRPTGVVAPVNVPTQSQQEQLHSRGIPIVLVDPMDEPDPALPSVAADSWGGGLAATRHLLRLGHRRIAAITGSSGSMPSRARLDGYRTALETAGIPVDPVLIREGDFHLRDGLAHGQELLRLPDPPTAVFAFNDAQAVGVYQAAHQLGLRIPEDLSVVGFDDLPTATWAIPALTTVHQPLRDMAATATRMLIDIAHGTTTPHRSMFATELITRASTAPPRG
ncbi:LacI family DNA-binding transcriptional regulator [Saccharothrix sp. NRRL B-16348]|uniref:LacI family DNA-binding transcriptional regulator n=1 Tax=Saccharothrix sp. NRRL B-16348 TaxID=1415542 RepID=UPI0006AE1033|nr:LacI family DNA-binding transcriptional regulator [Saccharothrix sp. NRRL B-16348]